ncbi:MAG: DUF3800 domain-containing protein [Armatimonadota bacterium]|nr:DUF3800 domain-containing protein [bacterium]
MIYFYGDESGSLSKYDSSWFVLGGYYINEDDRQKLEEGWRQIHKAYKVNVKQEIKHSGLKKALTGGQKETDDCLQHLNTIEIIDLTNDIIQLALSLDSLRIIVAAGQGDCVMNLSFVQNADEQLWGKTQADTRCRAMFIQNIMQAFELDLRKARKRGAMWLDRMSNGKHQQTSIQNYFIRLVRDQQDRFREYRMLESNINFIENDSCWEQRMADHIVGHCADFLNGTVFCGRSMVDLKSKFRCDENGNIAKRGIIGIPAGCVDEIFL